MPHPRKNWHVKDIEALLGPEAVERLNASLARKASRDIIPVSDVDLNLATEHIAWLRSGEAGAPTTSKFQARKAAFYRVMAKMVKESSRIRQNTLQYITRLQAIVTTLEREQDGEVMLNDDAGSVLDEMVNAADPGLTCPECKAAGEQWPVNGRRVNSLGLSIHRSKIHDIHPHKRSWAERQRRQAEKAQEKEEVTA